MKGINVKVPVKRVIDSLEAKLETMRQEDAAYEVAQAEYEIAKAKWEHDVMTAVLAKGVQKNINLHRHWRGNLTLEVSYDVSSVDNLPAEPEAPANKNRTSDYDKQNIENALRILRMTDEETVNATTFKAISQWL